MEMTFDSGCPKATIELGRRIGQHLRGGEVLAVCGTIGSGKTHLIKGIALGAGAEDVRQVSSPTFVIVNEYAGRLDIYHIDAYRLDCPEEFEKIGFADFCYPDSVVLIEWADKIESVLQGDPYVRITLTHLGPRRRRIRMENGPAYLASAFGP